MMKKSRFTEDQIAMALHRAEDGVSVEEVCRKLGISDATFYKWKQKYGGLLPSEVRKLKQLEEENKRVNHLSQSFFLCKF
jgi:putative transposase